MSLDRKEWEVNSAELAYMAEMAHAQGSAL